MIAPDFTDRTYTAEVIKARKNASGIFESISKMVEQPTMEEHAHESDQSQIRLCHGFLRTTRDYHRYSRIAVQEGGRKITIPRTVRVRDRDLNLYDALVAYHANHVVVAVPFHDLAEQFFVEVHRDLAGRNAQYEKLDITRLVMQLASKDGAQLAGVDSGDALTLAVTRCHLVFSDQQNRTSYLQQIRMNGTNLGMCKEYATLVDPVFKPTKSALTVRPTVLGFALLANGVRKSSATTDLHGNFKLWVAPGLRRLIRIFWLLDALESKTDVISTTSNLPILQSGTIRHAED